MIEVRDGVTVVECVEYGYLNIDASLWMTEGHATKFNSEIDGRDILRASFKNGIVTLQATSYVGVIRSTTTSSCE